MTFHVSFHVIPITEFLPADWTFERLRGMNLDVYFKEVGMREFFTALVTPLDLVSVLPSTRVRQSLAVNHRV